MLFDPARRVARQAGVEVTPQSVVLLPDGQVIYRGRIDDRYSSDGQKSNRPGRSDLRSALAAILADRMPPAQDLVGYGTSLGPIPASALGPDEPITFNKHVARILWDNCADAIGRGMWDRFRS